MAAGLVLGRLVPGTKAAFQTQIERPGFSLVELISSCPTWWRMKPLEAFAHIEENMLPQYPLKVFVDKT